MKKQSKHYLIAWAILLVLFNGIAFAMPGWITHEKFTASFWIGYVFVTVSFVGQLFCACRAFRAENKTKLFYSIPLIRISYTGLVITFIFGGLSMLLSALPGWVAAVVAVIVLAATAVAVIKADAAAELVEQVDETVKNRTALIRSLTAEAESLQAAAKSSEAKAACKKVYEALRYSDPMSNEGLAEVEQTLAAQFAKFAEAIKEENMEALRSEKEAFDVLLAKRNRMCKELK